MYESKKSYQMSVFLTLFLKQNTNSTRQCHHEFIHLSFIKIISFRTGVWRWHSSPLEWPFTVVCVACFTVVPRAFGHLECWLILSQSHEFTKRWELYQGSNCSKFMIRPPFRKRFGCFSKFILEFEHPSNTYMKYSKL